MPRLKSLFLFPFRLLHYIYLQIQAPFRTGNAYLLEIPSEFRESDKTFFMELISGRTEKPTYLQFLSLLRRISENTDIKKLFYIAEEADFGLAEMYEIGKAFERLKNRGVRLCAYSSKGDYKTLYLLSFADERYVHPKAEFIWLLPAAESFFFHGALKKSGIEVESFASGKYKSYAETFTRSGFSKEAKQNLESLLKSLNDQILETMLANTGDSDWKDRSPLLNAGLLKEMKFADHMTQDDFRDNCVYEDMCAPENEDEEKEETYEILSYSSLKYRHRKNRFRFIRYPKEKIAVIPLKGDITDSERDET
ncbi:MAG TPA: S49 family peptidase, partial [Leptospiraceae bacterium]|nr:S49 family peptidase [Leptospiraceae bacterium]